MNKERFETLVNEFQRRLYLHALQILRNHEDAEEAVQDAFMRAYRAWEEASATTETGVRVIRCENFEAYS